MGMGLEFRNMKGKEGIAGLLRKCGQMKALTEGKRLHASLIAMGLDSDTFLGNTLLDMYGKCGCFIQARGVSDRMCSRNVFTWTLLMGAYIRDGQAGEVLSLFDRMRSEGVKPDSVACLSALKACTVLGSLKHGKCVHAGVASCNFARDPFVASTLVDMYAKCGSLGNARRVFDRMQNNNSAPPWNALIAGYARNGLTEDALTLLEQMFRQGINPDVLTFIAALKACASSGSLRLGKSIHSAMKKVGFDGFDAVAGSALIDMYIRCGSIESAREAFDRICHQDLISWSTMIVGYAQHRYHWKALALFKQMQEEGGIEPDKVVFVGALKACAGAAALAQGEAIHESIKRKGFDTDGFIGSSLVDMYAKCGSMEKAEQVFSGMCERDVVTWSSMIVGYAEHGHGNEAFALFECMRKEGVKPDEVAFISVLKACAGGASLQHGKQVHACLKDNDSSLDGGGGGDVFIVSALVDMYMKCGSIENAWRVFDGTGGWRNVVTWNAMIAGCARHGHGKQALTLLKQMQREGIEPDDATFASVFAACGHAGLVDEAYGLLDLMNESSGIAPKARHYLCMVDLLSRTGRLIEAEELINKMPIQPDARVWKALLSGCNSDGNKELGRYTFDCIKNLGMESGIS